MALWIAMLAAGLLHVTLLFAHGAYIALAHGLKWGVGRRSLAVQKSDLDRRFERSIANNVESLAAFAPVAAATLYVTNNGPAIEFAALIYIASRIGFVLVYLANLPYVRTVFWLSGQIALLCIVGVGFQTAIRGL